MKIRTLLALGLLIAALVPAGSFALWSYDHGMKRELEEVRDRHLLLAQNLSNSMSRYHADLIASTDSIANYLLQGERPHNLHSIMRGLNILCVHIIDSKTQTAITSVDHRARPVSYLPPNYTFWALEQARQGKTVFSHVMPGRNGESVLLAARKYGDRIAISVVATTYFKKLGASVSFGKKGHAAIVDQRGNVLAHPMPSWVEARKNIRKVSAVNRMLNGETGVTTFYSPALRADMVAGFTNVPGPNWGVMIPQPLSELQNKVLANSKSLALSLGMGVVVVILFILLFVNSLARPIEHFLRTLNEHTLKGRLEAVTSKRGILRVREVGEFFRHYNALVHEVNTVNSKVEQAAFTDGLTGLPNRTRLIALSSGLLNSAAPVAGSIGSNGASYDDHGTEQSLIASDGKPSEPISSCGMFVFVDLDDFKQINDIHGHGSGDRFLKIVARRLTEVVEAQWQAMGVSAEEDLRPVVARIGGDEFAITFPGLNEITQVEAFLGKLVASIDSAGYSLPGANDCRASIGAALYPQHGQTFGRLMRLADIAMYHAKKRGKGRYQIFDETIGNLSVSELRAAVEAAIDKDELTLEYQPKVCCRTRMIRSVEALVRWDHPEHGRIAPNEWIPAIVNSPVMLALGEWVADRAMKDQMRWERNCIRLNVAINVGAEHFSHPNFVARMCEIAKDNGFDPGNMELEITENTAFANEQRTDTVIESLHRAGFQIAIDDFGTGYSNMARLARLPVDSLKVDRSVINNALTDQRVAHLLRCVIAMARALGCKTVAEGIESQEHIDMAEAQGVHILQGFYFSGSLGASELEKWVRANQPSDEVPTTVLTPLPPRSQSRVARIVAA